MLQVILLSAMGMLTAALFIAKYQSQMFDISSRHFRFIELMHRRRLAMTSMLFFASVAFIFSFVNIFQGVING